MRPPPRSTLFPYTTLFRSQSCYFPSSTKRSTSVLIPPGRENIVAGWVRVCKSGFLAMRNSVRSEEHTSELQSQSNLVCRLLLEKKKQINVNIKFLVYNLSN